MEGDDYGTEVDLSKLDLFNPTEEHAAEIVRAFAETEYARRPSVQPRRNSTALFDKCGSWDY